jgi:poly-gamma-glutamate capsule biosynthesis protein CapA/YwtB (metallophosphatase superfamily)
MDGSTPACSGRKGAKSAGSVGSAAVGRLYLCAVERPRLRLLLAASMLVVAGCGSDGDDGIPGGLPGRVTSAAASGAPTATPSPSGPVDLTLAFAGDVHFQERVAPLLNDTTTTFGPIAATLSAADLTIVNLETAITTRGTPEPKEFKFRTVPKALDAVRAAGIDVVSLANNHTLDYGQVGLADTLAAVKAAQMPVFGAGANAAEAYAPWLTTVKGVKIAVLGFSQVHELEATWAAKDNRGGIAMAGDLPRVTAAVTAARQQADLVIVFNHWGTEGAQCPNAEQRTFAAKLAAAGADIIVGAHAHTLQGDGWLGRTYVAYGMGNFLWYRASRSTETGVLKLTVRGRTVVKNELHPAVVSNTGQPVPLTGTAATKLTQRYAGLRACTGLAVSPTG